MEKFMSDFILVVLHLIAIYRHVKVVAVSKAKSRYIVILTGLTAYLVRAHGVIAKVVGSNVVFGQLNCT